MSNVRMEVHAVSVSGFANVVVSGRIPTQDEVDRAINPGNMPPEWACYGRNEYACPEHTA